MRARRVEYLPLADYLLIAEAVLDASGELIARLPRIGLAESRAAFLAGIEFAARNGHEWQRASGDPDETDAVFRAVADGSMGESELRDWIEQRIPTAVGRPRRSVS